MRIANLILTLIVSLFLTIQSFAIMAASSISESLSDSAADKKEAEALGAGAASGILAAILWVVAAALVIAKPKLSFWIFIAATAMLTLGATVSEFSDLWFYAGASLAFALMAHLGVKEQTKQDEREQVRYQADLALAAQAVATGSTPPPN